MIKKIVSVFFTILLIFTGSFCAFAYEPNSFTVSAEAGILVSLDTGEVLFEKNIDKKMYPASLTKIMTVLIILESDRYNPTEKIAMRADVDKYITGTGSAVSHLNVGEEITQLDLVHYVLMSSAGDCAYLAALHYGDTVENFMQMMNDKAQSLGLTGTHYGNPVGLHDEETYTTVRDVRILAEYALKNETFKTVCSSSRYTVEPTNMSGKRVLSTTNFLQDTTTNYYYPYAKGVKTGFTNQAGRCLVSTASYDGYNYLCILMKCPNNGGTREEFVESKELYRWAFNNFEYKQVADTENPVAEVKVELNWDIDHIPVYIKDGFVTILPKDSDTSTIKIVPRIKIEKTSLDAPVKKGDKICEADIIYAEKILGTVDLVAGATVEKSTFLGINFDELWRGIKSFFGSKAMIVIYCIIGAVVIIFICMVIYMNSGKTKKRKVKYIPYSEEKGNRNHKK